MKKIRKSNQKSAFKATFFSKISKNYIKHPSEVLSVGDIVDCYVLEILDDKKKVNLSLLNPNEED